MGIIRDALAARKKTARIAPYFSATRIGRNASRLGRLFGGLAGAIGAALVALDQWATSKQLASLKGELKLEIGQLKMETKTDTMRVLEKLEAQGKK